MNERIRQLAEQAGVKMNAYGRPIPASLASNFDELAELIVAECIRMCDVAAVGYETHGHMKEANGCYSAKEYIEEHFGVE